jgi:hypothetical protein
VIHPPILNRTSHFSFIWKMYMETLLWIEKPGGCGLVILGLKIKRASVCRLHHKTDGGRSACDTCQDLTACFAWKQIWLEFSSLASRLVDVRRWVVYVAPLRRLRRGQVEYGRVDATDYVGPCYPCFVIFLV